MEWETTSETHLDPERVYARVLKHRVGFPLTKTGLKVLEKIEKDFGGFNVTSYTLDWLLEMDIRKGEFESRLKSADIPYYLKKVLLNIVNSLLTIRKFNSYVVDVFYLTMDKILMFQECDKGVCKPFYVEVEIDKDNKKVTKYLIPVVELFTREDALYAKIILSVAEDLLFLEKPSEDKILEMVAGTSLKYGLPEIIKAAEVLIGYV